ncbi:MAG TPA: hypothetical protein VMB85_21445 [Bryobacteraceae bacterium]|jgi:hypothetical protein|nr:hypothetical protein [Bryobacteraceae bacterium]
MKTKFRALVRDLDAAALDELRRSVAAELEGRRQQSAIKLEDIHPRMSAEDKQRAMREIARALRGDEHA